MRIETKPIIFFVCGIPRSGKSEFIKEHLKGKKIISFDDIIMSLYGTETYNEAYDIYSKLSPLEKGVVSRIAKDSLSYASKLNLDIVMDYTALQDGWLEKTLLRVKDNYEKRIIVMDTSFSTILSRNSLTTDKQIPLEVLERFRAKFETKPWEDFDWALTTVICTP